MLCYLLISKISILRVPLGTLISAISPTDLPKSPLPIGELTDIFPALRSASLSAKDFWAVWCGPCRMLAPVVEEISKEYEGRVVVGKVDVDNNQEFAAKYGIRNIPTVLVFQNGEVVGRQVGVAPKKTYTDALDGLLS